MRNIERALADRALRSPDCDAVIHIRTGQAPERVSVADLNARANSFAEFLGSRVDPRRLVLMYMNRSAHAIAGMVGTARAGGVFATVNRRFRPAQVLELARQSGAAVVICDNTTARRMAEASHHDDPEIVAAVSRNGDAPVHLESLVATSVAVAHRVPPWPMALSDAACCLFTSGSTGTPKGVLISSDDLDARAAAEVELFGLSDADRLLGILPFSFDVGLNQLLTSLLTGAPLVLTDSWLPADLVRTVREQRITGISAVPTIWRDVLKTGFDAESLGDAATLRYITVSGGSLVPTELLELHNRFPRVGVFLTYGQTETFRSSALRPTELLAKTGSVGRPFAGARVRIVDESGHECAPNIIGEVVHAGLGVMIGYLDAEDTTHKLRPNPWVADDRCSVAVWTGDYGYFDEDGYLFLKGRRDGMLKVAGHRFYPGEIASVALGSSGVAEVEVIGVPRGDGESEVVAYIVAAHAASGIAERVRDLVRSKLPSYMVPARVIAVPSIPRLPNGKPDLQQLQRHARAAH